MTGSNDSYLSESAPPQSGLQSPAPALTPDTGSTVTGFSAFLYFCFSFEICFSFSGNQTDPESLTPDSVETLPANDDDQGPSWSPEIRALISQAIDCTVDAGAYYVKAWIKKILGV